MTKIFYIKLTHSLQLDRLLEYSSPFVIFVLALVRVNMYMYGCMNIIQNVCSLLYPWKNLWVLQKYYLIRFNNFAMKRGGRVLNNFRYNGNFILLLLGSKYLGTNVLKL